MSNVVRVHLGLLREAFPGEHRVALTPDDVRRLSTRLSIRFQPGCGVEAGHSDNDYISAGAEPAERDELLTLSDMLVGVRRPENHSSLKPNSIVAYLGSGTETHAAASMEKPRIHLDLARLAGLRDAGPMDVASRQAAITGHAAVIEAARQLGIAKAMLTVDGNFVRPVAMAAIGTDPSGLQAIATARRLGAVTHGFGFDTDSRQKIERLGARYLSVDTELTFTHPIERWDASDLTSLRRQLANHLSRMQLIVTSVAQPGKTAPTLLDEEVLSALNPGTVIVDLAAEHGGNCYLTQVDRTIEISGVRIIGTTTLASREPAHASGFFGEGMRTVIERLLGEDNTLQLDRIEPLTGAMGGDRQMEGRFAN